MSERYKKVKLYESFKFSPTCPVDILRGAIYIDNISNKTVFQLKFINMQEKIIKALYIQIKGFDDLGEELTNNEYQYLDLNVYKRQEFGTEQLKELNNNTIRNIEITINKIIYSDNQIWENKDTVSYDRVKLQNIDNTLVNVANEKIMKQGIHINNLYYPTQNENYWTCVCGAYNSNKNEKCYMCGYNNQKELKDFLPTILENELKLYKEQTKLKAKKNKILIFIGLALIIIIITIILSCVIFPKFDKNAEYQLFTKDGYYALINKSGYVIELSFNKKEDITEIFWGNSIDISKNEKISSDYIERFKDFSEIIQIAKRNGINNISVMSAYNVSDTEFNYDFSVGNKQIYLGNMENMQRKFESIKLILKNEREKIGTIDVSNVDNVHFIEKSK